MDAAARQGKVTDAYDLCKLQRRGRKATDCMSRHDIDGS